MTHDTGAHSRRAFSLIEAMVAVAVLACAVLPVVALSQRGVTEAAVLRDEVLARQLLIDLSERYKDADPEELARVAADRRIIEKDPMLQPLERLGAPAGLRRGLSLVRDLDGASGLHQLSFEVIWNDRTGRRRRVSLERLIHAH